MRGKVRSEGRTTEMIADMLKNSSGLQKFRVLRKMMPSMASMSFADMNCEWSVSRGGVLNWQHKLRSWMEKQGYLYLSDKGDEAKCLKYGPRGQKCNSWDIMYDQCNVHPLLHARSMPFEDFSTVVIGLLVHF